MDIRARDLAVVGITLAAQAPFLIGGVLIGTLFLIASAAAIALVAFGKSRGRTLIEFRPKR